MKRYILNLFGFTVFLLTVLGTIMYSVSYIISRGDYFSIPKDKTNIIIGHSLSACAFDDKLIEGFYNVSQPCEGYPYSFYKVLKLLENNSQIKNIFIEYTNGQISPWAINRVSGIYLNVNIPRLFPVMEKKVLVHYLYRNGNLKTIFNTIKKSFNVNLSFLINKETNYVEYMWKTHETPTHVYIPENIKIENKKTKNASELGFFQDFYSIEKTNLKYLTKITKIAKQYNVNIYFVRSPLSQFSNTDNELIFQNILDTNFDDIKFLDFKDFPLTNNYYADEKHLNVIGQKKFSLFFNKLYKKGILKKDDFQSLINAEYIVLENNKQ